MAGFDAKGWVDTFLAAVGAVLGVYNFVRRKRDRHDADALKTEDMAFYTEVVSAQQRSPSTVAIRVEPGSAHHAIAERLVARGMLKRDRDGRSYFVKAD